MPLPLQSCPRRLDLVRGNFQLNKKCPVIQEAPQKYLHFNKNFPWENFEDEGRVTLYKDWSLFCLNEASAQNQRECSSQETSTERPN